MNIFAFMSCWYFNLQRLNKQEEIARAHKMNRNICTKQYETISFCQEDTYLSCVGKTDVDTKVWHLLWHVSRLLAFTGKCLSKLDSVGA